LGSGHVRTLLADAQKRTGPAIPPVRTAAPPIRSPLVTGCDQAGEDDAGGAGQSRLARDLEPLLGRLRCLEGRRYRVVELPGGLTNRNVKVVADGDCYVVRLFTQGAALLSIDRDNEHHNSLAAARAGVGAPVVEYRPDLGVLVLGFIEARTFGVDDLRRGEHIGRVASACRALHGGARCRNDFDMARIQADYLSVVQANGFRLPPGYLDFQPQVARISRALAASAEGTVPCNNDLLAENILDDGRHIWLIDYEYSGNNDPCFELGNLWSESGLTLDQLAELIEAYYGRPEPQKVARARLQGLMSKYGWTLWASISASTTPIDFDFWEWGMEKYDRAVAEFKSPEFDGLVDRAAESAGRTT
jgi:thiamine kinase-like enzyme